MVSFVIRGLSGKYKETTEYGLTNFNNFNMIKSLAKTVIGVIFYYTGAFDLVRFVNNLLGKRLTIVTYHRVTDQKINEIRYSLPYLFVNSNTFEKHISFYKKNYKIIDFNKLSQYGRKRDIPKNSLIITFDDGYADNFTTALPVLKKYGVPCTIFLVTEKMGRSEVPWWDEVFARLESLTEMGADCTKKRENQDVMNIYTEYRANPSEFFFKLSNWEEIKIRKLIDLLRDFTSVPEDILIEENRFFTWREEKMIKGLVDFGSHGRTHVSLPCLPVDRIKREVFLSKKEIQENCQQEPIAFSYPAGHYSVKIQDLVKQSGYCYGVTQDRGINDLKCRYALKRINLWEGSANKTNGKFSKALFAWRLSGIP